MFGTRCLATAGCKVTVVPATASAEEILEREGLEVERYEAAPGKVTIVSRLKASGTPVAKPIVPETIVKTPHPGEVNAEDFTLENVLKHWTDIVKRTNPPSARMSLKNASVTAVEDKSLVLSFPSAFHRDKVNDVNSSRAIEEILQDIFKRPVRIDCRLETVRPAAASSTPATDTDLVDAAKEVFGM